jgi:hypothetical protein
MTLSKDDIAIVIKMLLNGTGHRSVVVNVINVHFLNYTMDFFKRVMLAKLDNTDISIDWYRKSFIEDSQISSDDLVINSGLNKKTVTNQYHSAKREICIEAANENYEALIEILDGLIDEEIGLDIRIVLKQNGVSVELTINESLIVVNALAVKRAAIRGGAWSTLGKSVETPLMVTLCKLFHVAPSNYAIKKSKGKIIKPDEFNFDREVDFYLIGDDKQYNCEVKLMGQGNPESADAIIARDTNVFIADSLSDTNRAQLNSLKVHWVELRAEEGYMKFSNVLTKLNIPHQKPDNGLDQLANILATLRS